MRLTTIIPGITILMCSIVQQRERVYAWLKAMRDSWDNYALRAVETIMLWERRDHTGVLGTSSHQSNCLELLHFLAAAPSLSSIWPGYNNAIRRHTRHSADAAETAMGTSSLYCTVLYCTVLYCTETATGTSSLPSASHCPHSGTFRQLSSFLRDEACSPLF